MKTYRMREKKPCAWCGVGNDGYMNVFGNEKIRPGDTVTMCIHCGNLSVIIDDQGTTRRPTLQEWHIINIDRRFDFLLMAWKQWHEDRSYPWLINRPKAS